MHTIETMLRAELESLRDKRKAPRNTWIVYDYLLREGRYYPGRKLPARYKLGGPRCCFANAKRLVRRSKDLIYAEGFALYLPRAEFGSLAMFHHAWAVTPEGEVLDPTLAESDAPRVSSADRYEYFGILYPDRSKLTDALLHRSAR
jgi:hypothetical protein